jgi:cytosine/creatinine deaminase
MVTTRAARALGRPERVLAAGAVADLVVLEAETTTDILRGAAPRRTTIKGGKLVGGTSTDRWLRHDETPLA